MMQTCVRATALHKALLTTISFHHQPFLELLGGCTRLGAHAYRQSAYCRLPSGYQSWLIAIGQAVIQRATLWIADRRSPADVTAFALCNKII